MLKVEKIGFRDLYIEKVNPVQRSVYGTGDLGADISAWNLDAGISALSR